MSPSTIFWKNEGVEVECDAYDFYGNLVDFDMATGDAPTPSEPDPTVTYQRSAAFQNEHQTSAGVLKNSYTNDEAIAIAQRFDDLMVQMRNGDTVPIFDAAQIALMKQTNPRFKIRPYVRGSETTNSNLIDPRTGQPDETMYAHTGFPATSSNRARHTFGTTSLYIMQLDHPGVQQIVATQALARYNSTVGFDGVFLDVLGDFPLSLGVKKPGTNINYSSAEWYAISSLIPPAVEALLPAEATVIANGLGYGNKYPTSKILLTAGGTGAIAEIFARVPSQTTDARNASAAANEVSMLQQATALAGDKIVVAMTKDWTNQGYAIAEQRIKFGWGLYMMGADGVHTFACSIGRQQSLDGFPWQYANYGSPSGAATRSGDVWQRAYQKATIVVNTGTSSWTGTVLGQTVTVPAYRCQIVPVA